MEEILGDKQKQIQISKETRKIVDKLNPKKINKKWKEYIEKIVSSKEEKNGKNKK